MGYFIKSLGILFLAACRGIIHYLGISMTELSRRLNPSFSGESQSVSRGEKIAEINGFKLLNKKL
jgi:hypothetical protein